MIEPTQYNDEQTSTFPLTGDKDSRFENAVKALKKAAQGTYSLSLCRYRLRSRAVVILSRPALIEGGRYCLIYSKLVHTIFTLIKQMHHQ